ncbi:MAG: CAP domain-containing protein [Polyangiaceae bacterium]
MRLASARAALVITTCATCTASVASFGSAGCGGGSSDGAKIGQALAFATVAAVAQIAQSEAEARARKAAAAQSSSAVRVTPQCDNEDQYACISIAAGAARPPDVPDHEMTAEEAHEYVLGYVNGIRKLSHLPALVRDPALDAFALAGSMELAQDHRQNQHIIDRHQEFAGRSSEIQGSPEGLTPGPLEDQIGATLVRWVAEGPGGMHHDAIVSPTWRKLGAGLVSVEGRAYFTVDFGSE